MFDTGAGLIEIFAKGGENHSEGSVRHFALATDDTDACVKAIREAGYKITVEPTDLTIPAETLFPVRIAFAVGPCGESIGSSRNAECREGGRRCAGIAGRLPASWKHIVICCGTATGRRETPYLCRDRWRRQRPEPRQSALRRP